MCFFRKVDFSFSTFLGKNLKRRKRNLQCSNCGHLNKSGKFCVKCGSKLGEGGVKEQVAATADHSATHTYSQPSGQPAQPNQHVENAKHISKMYIGYFMQGIKNPLATAQGVGDGQFINALITIILYAISIPLMMYFGWKMLLVKFFGVIYTTTTGEQLESDFGSGLLNAKPAADASGISFVDVVVKQSIFMFIALVVIVAVTYGVVKLAKIDVSFKELFARFGTFSIVPTGLFIVGIVLSLIHIDIFVYFLLFGLLGILFVIPLTITSFKNNTPGGLDKVYSILITYVVTIIALSMVSKGLLEEAKAIVLSVTGDELNSLF